MLKKKEREEKQKRFITSDDVLDSDDEEKGGENDSDDDDDEEQTTAADELPPEEISEEETGGPREVRAAETNAREIGKGTGEKKEENQSERTEVYAENETINATLEEEELSLSRARVADDEGVRVVVPASDSGWSRCGRRRRRKKKRILIPQPPMGLERREKREKRMQSNRSRYRKIQ